MGNYIAIIMALFMSSAWLTHVIICLLEAKYLLLISGAFMFPVGIIHGIGIWFGVNW